MQSLLGDKEFRYNHEPERLEAGINALMQELAVRNSPLLKLVLDLMTRKRSLLGLQIRPLFYEHELIRLTIMQNFHSNTEKYID